MVSKNNMKHKLEQDAKRVPHYGIRKLSIGVASVLIGTTLYFGTNSTVLADTTNSNNTSTEVLLTDNSLENSDDSSSPTQLQNNSIGLITTLATSNRGSAVTTQATATSTSVNNEKSSVSQAAIRDEAEPLTATLSDGTTLTISRNTVGATGETTPISVTLNLHNYQAGDVYTVTIPKGTYSINTGGNNLASSIGTTTTTESDSAVQVVDMMKSGGANTLQQNFTINPGNNYGGQASPMSIIGEILKNITITKTNAAGEESKSVQLTQIVDPEMYPTFARTTPTSSSLSLYPNVDYTYSLSINETTGVAQGNNYVSNRINSAVNTEAIITIPVPDSFILNNDQTAIANNFTDGTTISQPDGKGGNIIITVPKGAGSQNYNNQDPYRIVGHYDTNMPAHDKTITADAPIHIDQTVTKVDGSTYHITKDLTPWSDKLIGADSTVNLPDVQSSAFPYVVSQQIPIDVDATSPLNTFGFINSTSMNLTDAQLKIIFPDGFQISKITTPVDLVYLPGTTSYGYEIIYTDGATQSGTVSAGGVVNANTGKYIQSIVFKPDQLAAGAQAGGRSLQDKNHLFQAYGTIAKTLSDGTAITDGHEFNSTIMFSYQVGGKTSPTAISTAKQTVTQRKAALGTFTYQRSQAPGTNDAGYLSIVTDGNASATTNEIYEPIFYYVLPQGTSFDDAQGLTTPNGSVQPTITTFMSDNQQVVKIDYTGTGYSVKTDVNSNNQIHLNNSPLANVGSYEWDIYVYSPITKLLQGMATDYAGWNSSDTGGQADDVYRLGGGFWTIGLAKSASINTVAQGNRDVTLVANGTSDDKGTGKMDFAFNVTNNLKDLSNAVAVVSLDHNGSVDFTLTGPITGGTIPVSDILYSTSSFAENGQSTADLTGFVAGDQVTDWSKIKTVAVRMGSLSLKEASDTFVIHGEDKTIAEDAGKTVGLYTYFFADGMQPASGLPSANATLKIIGQSTVTSRLAYEDVEGNTQYLDFPDLTKTYTDNQEVMQQDDFALTGADHATIDNLISQLEQASPSYVYHLVEMPTIINGNKTWQTDANNSIATFGETARYYYDSDIVQYQLVRELKQHTIKYSIVDDTDKKVLEIGNLGSGAEDTDLTNTEQGGYEAKYTDNIKAYINQGYVLMSRDEIPTNYGKMDQTIMVHLVHGTTIVNHDKDVKRTVEYYDRTTGEALPSYLAPTRTQTVHFTNTEVKDTVNGTSLGYNTSDEYATYKDLNGNDVKVYKVDTTDENQAWQSNNTSFGTVTNPDLQSHGYEPATDENGAAMLSEAEQTVTVNDPDTTIKVYYNEHVVPVDSSTIAISGQPISTGSEYTWPMNSETTFDPTNFQSTSSRQIIYQYEDGRQAAGPVTETVTFNQVGTMNLVTGVVTKNNDWQATASTIVKNGQSTDNADKDKYGAVISPNIPGYTPDQATVSDAIASQGTDGNNIVVTYKADPQEVTYTVHDNTINQDIVIGNHLGTGASNGDITDETKMAYQDLINQYEQLGYIIISQGALPEKYDNNDKVNQNVVITIAHKVVTVTSRTTDADVPKQSDGSHAVDSSALSKTVGLIVNYQNSDATSFTGEIPTNATNQTITLNGTAYIDAVTGQLTNQPTTDGNGHDIVDSANTATPTITWTTGTTETVESPTESGYHTITNRINPITINVNDAATIDSGLTSGDTVTLGRNTRSATITRTVTYAKNPAVEVVYVDQDNHNEVIPNTGSGTLTGTAEQPINYSTGSTISTLENAGYELVANDFDPNGTAPNYSNDDTDTQRYTVTMRHKNVTVEPSAPKTTTDTLPDNPSRNYPAGVGESDLNRTVTRTINVHRPDGTTATTQQVNLTRTATVDEVTGDVTYSNWTTDTWPAFTDIPSLPGYTAGQTQVDAQNVTSSTENTTVDIYYTPRQQTINYQIVDDTTGNTLSGDTPVTLVTGDSDSDVPTSAHSDLSNVIKGYEDQGYVLISGNEVPTRFDHDDNDNQTITVHLAHGTQDVSRTKTTTETIHYIYSNGQTAAPDVTQAVTFTQTGTEDLVTNETTWNPVNASQSFSAVTSPSLSGYTPDVREVPATTVNFNDSDINRTVTYTADPQELTVTYIDDVTGQVLKTVTRDGNSDQSANYNTASDIQAFEDENYVLVSDSTNGQDLVFDHDDGSNQNYTVHLTHQTEPASQTKTVTRTINYVDNQTGQQLAPSVTQTVTFTQTGTRDLVTGQVTWNPTDSQTFASVNSPRIDGYNDPSIPVVDEQTVNIDNSDTVVNVTYTKPAPVVPGNQDHNDNGGDSNVTVPETGNETTHPSSTVSGKTQEGQVASKQLVATNAAQPVQKNRLPQTSNDRSKLGLLGFVAASFAGLLSLRKKKGN